MTELRKSLDPEDWDEFRRLSHRALDKMIDDFAHLRQRPVWVAPPDEALRRLDGGLPREPRGLSSALADFSAAIKPYGVSNRHKDFMGWAHGAGTPAGMLAASAPSARRWRAIARRPAVWPV